MRVNLEGVINMSRKFLPELKSRPEAALINTSSIFGMVAVPTQSVYHATKFAVRGFTESLVKEMKGTNLQVHSVHPGTWEPTLPLPQNGLNQKDRARFLLLGAKNSR